MKSIKKFFCYTLLGLLALLMLVAVAGYLILRHSLPELDGKVTMSQLSKPVTVTTDSHGLPVVTAANRSDAIRALGYVTARDRLFQMDLMRRKIAGRLAEIVGELAVDSDIEARTYGFHRVAKAVVEKLPAEHRRYLEAYAAGVNTYLSQAKTLPLEFTVLGYTPEPWKPEDSMLVVLGMFNELTSRAQGQERMLTVMEKILPADVVAFLTPDTDAFTDSLLGSSPSWRPAQSIPVAALVRALSQAKENPQQLSNAVQLKTDVKGSNAWAVSGTKTRDGRALLANDMHLGLNAPAIWYRCEVNYGKTHAAGVYLPGTPVLVSGSNNDIAWGSTNLTGDFLDLVSLDINPHNTNEYRTQSGWQAFEQIPEAIKIKNAPARQITVKRTIWGPVAAKTLLDKPVAIHWAALDNDALNIAPLELEEAQTLAQSLDIVNRAGGPQLNFLVADKLGNIAWTIMGKIPDRFGIDGSVSRSWADGTAGWKGYVPPNNLPRVINPPEGFLASANNRRLGKKYPHVIGHEFANGYRAYRISQRLKQMREINEWSMFELQLDTESEFFAFYQQLALSVVPPELAAQQPKLQELRDTLLAWNGRADAESLGFALLQKFRNRLAKNVISPYLAACKKTDSQFEYSWLYVDTPLQALLSQKPPELNPDPVKYADWNAFIREQLVLSAEQLKAQYPDTPLPALTWGQTHKARIGHPIFQSIPLLGKLYSMPEDELAGCGQCVRAVMPSFGATERLVVSPAHLADGILHTPAGQSSHPLSPNYADQQRYWVQGLALGLLAGKAEHTLVFKPDTD